MNRDTLHATSVNRTEFHVPRHPTLSLVISRDFIVQRACEVSLLLSKSETMAACHRIIHGMHLTDVKSVSASRTLAPAALAGMQGADGREFCKATTRRWLSDTSLTRELVSRCSSCSSSAGLSLSALSSRTRCSSDSTEQLHEKKENKKIPASGFARSRNLS